MGKERIGVDMGNKMVEFAGEDRSSRVGLWKIDRTTSMCGGGLPV